MYQNSFGKSFLCNHEIVPVHPWNLVRLYVALLRTFPLSHFATMPEPEPRPVRCFTLIHLFRLRFNLENILAISLPSSRALAGYMFRFRPLVPAQSHLGEHRDVTFLSGMKQHPAQLLFVVAGVFIGILLFRFAPFGVGTYA
jgi:hypothetical protein